MLTSILIKGIVFVIIVLSFQPDPEPPFQSDFFIEAIEQMNLDDEEDYINAE